MKARLIDIDGKDTIVEPKNGKNFTLEELYKMIGCDLVQLVTLPISGKYMIMGEEDKLKSNPQVNIVASNLWGDTVVGKVVICDRNMFK